MARAQSTKQPSQRTDRRSSLRFFVTALITTGFVATGGFGAFPDNPVTTTFQQEMGQNVPEAVLNPLNAYLGELSAFMIEPQPPATQNPSLDLVGLILGDAVEDPSPTVTVVETPSTIFTATGEAVASLTLTVTPTRTATRTSSPTSQFTPTPTATPDCSPPSSTPATTTFFNGSGQTIDVYLVDTACRLVLYARLGPEQSLLQETLIGQRWWFVNASTQHLVADYVVSSPIESVDVSTGTVTVMTATPSTVTATPFVGFTVSNADLSDDLTQFGTSITLAPGAEFYVYYDFQVFNDPCPTCITQLVTGLGASSTHGGTCAYNGVPGPFPGASSYESATLYAPTAPGTYPVVVEYHWEFSCASALSQYGTGASGSTRVIGQITVQ